MAVVATTFTVSQASTMFRSFPIVHCEGDSVLVVAGTSPVVVTESEETSVEKEKNAVKEEDFPQIEITDEECSIDDEEWLAEKEKCAFCRMFIYSPCRYQFKKWSMCVDKAKAGDIDYTRACSRYTRALMGCTSDHADHFQALEDSADHEPVRDDEK